MGIYAGAGGEAEEEEGYGELDAATFRGYLWEALLQSGNGGDLDNLVEAPPARLLANPQAAQLGRDALREPVNSQLLTLRHITILRSIKNFTYF